MGQTPRLPEIINAHIARHSESAYTALPGKIVAFNPSTQLASVQVQINQEHEKPSGETAVDFPTLVSVPVMFPGSGQCRITFPVGAGDKCLVVVSTFALGNWLKSGSPTTDETNPLNKNHLSSGFAIPGLFPSLKVKPPGPASLDDIVIHTDERLVKVGADATDFLALKDDITALKMALETAVISVGAGGASTIIAAAEAANALLDNGSVWPKGTTNLKTK